MIWEKPGASLPQKLGLDLRSGRRQKFTSHPTILKISRLEFNLTKIAKKIFLDRYNSENALQFNCELLPRSLVDLSYQSSDEDMDVDSINSTDDILDAASGDDDIQVLACYRYNTEFPPQLAVGRAMTTELTECLNDLNLPISEPIESVSTFSEPQTH